MAAQKGRDFLLQMQVGTTANEYVSIGAVRTNNLTLNNNPVDSTTMDDSGIQTLVADAGVQTMQIAADGIFKDASAEETLRAAAFARTSKNYQLAFPNGDTYEAAFVIQDYNRTGTYDGVETFSLTLVRSGGGTYTAAT